jgi:hypothetical protein
MVLFPPAIPAVFPRSLAWYSPLAKFGATRHGRPTVSVLGGIEPELPRRLRIDRRDEEEKGRDSYRVDEIFGGSTEAHDAEQETHKRRRRLTEPKHGQSMRVRPPEVHVCDPGSVDAGVRCAVRLLRSLRLISGSVSVTQDGSRPTLCRLKKRVSR